MMIDSQMKALTGACLFALCWERSVMIYIYNDSETILVDFDLNYPLQQALAKLILYCFILQQVKN